MLSFLFPFTIFVGIFALLVWAKLGSDLLVILIAVVILLQFVFSMISIPVFFNEEKYKWLYPLVLIHLGTLAIYLILAFVYIVLFIIVKSSNDGRRHLGSSTSRDGPRTGSDDIGVENITGGKIYNKTVSQFKINFQPNTVGGVSCMCCSCFLSNHF